MGVGGGGGGGGVGWGWGGVGWGGVMCCMLSTFHVSSRIVANISESSLFQ